MDRDRRLFGGMFPVSAVARFAAAAPGPRYHACDPLAGPSLGPQPGC
jgi:hypothetical protein